MVDVRLLLSTLLYEFMVLLNVDGSQSGAMQLHSNPPPDPYSPKSVQCCVEYGVEEDCLLTCHPDEDFRAFDGGMVCDFKYNHIVEACESGTRLKRRKDLYFLKNKSIGKHHSLPTEVRLPSQATPSAASVITSSNLLITSLACVFFLANR